jgi:DNA-binding MarR family transcriptional regulator
MVEAAPVPDRLALLLEQLLGLLHSNMAGETLMIMHESGLTMPQIVAMHVLRHHGAQSISSLQDFLGLSASATSHLVDRLVEHGSVARSEDPGDRRQKRVELRPQGHALLGRLSEARLRELGGVLTQLDPALQAQLAEIMQRAIANLQAALPAPRLPC